MLSDFNMSSTDAFRTGPAYILCINYPQVLGALFVVACSNLYLESWLFSDPSLPFHIHKKHTESEKQGANTEQSTDGGFSTIIFRIFDYRM